MTVTQQDLDGVHARVGRLEGKVESQQTELGKCAAGIAWIKGYLETHPDPPGPAFRRDAGMVLGGGGIVGVVVFVLEKIFGTGVLP